VSISYGSATRPSRRRRVICSKASDNRLAGNRFSWCRPTADLRRIQTRACRLRLHRRRTIEIAYRWCEDDRQRFPGLAAVPLVEERPQSAHPSCRSACANHNSIQLGRHISATRMTASGHEEQSAPPRPSGSCRFSKLTLVRALGNGSDAPLADTAGWPICH